MSPSKEAFLPLPMCAPATTCTSPFTFPACMVHLLVQMQGFSEGASGVALDMRAPNVPVALAQIAKHE